MPSAKSSPVLFSTDSSLSSFNFITLRLEEPRCSGVLELAVFFATVPRGPAEVLGWVRVIYAEEGAQRN